MLSTMGSQSWVGTGPLMILTALWEQQSGTFFKSPKQVKIHTLHTPMLRGTSPPLPFSLHLPRLMFPLSQGPGVSSPTPAGCLAQPRVAVLVAHGWVPPSCFCSQAGGGPTCPLPLLLSWAECRPHATQLEWGRSCPHPWDSRQWQQ